MLAFFVSKIIGSTGKNSCALFNPFKRSDKCENSKKRYIHP